MAQERNLPETMTAPETGERLTRGVRPFPVRYKGKAVMADLPGYYPEGDGEGVHVGSDMVVVDVALQRLKERSTALLAAARSSVHATPRGPRR